MEFGATSLTGAKVKASGVVSGAADDTEELEDLRLLELATEDETLTDETLEDVRLLDTDTLDGARLLALLRLEAGAKLVWH
jgi:hypothetical protein